MNARVTRRETCRLCGQAALDPALELEPTPLGDEFLPPAQRDREQPAYPLVLMLCRACGHVQLLNVVDPDAIYRDYTYASSVSLGLPEHFDVYAAEVLARNRIDSGFVVEMGSNEGAMLAAFKRRGLAVLGIDPAREIGRRATAAGLETLDGYFTAGLAREIRSQRGPADLVIANNVLANIDDLGEVAEGIRELLGPQGLFVFESSYLLDVVDHLLLDTIFHEHLSYFAARPLDAFFRHHGLELVHVQRTSPKGGSLRGTVQRADGGRPVDASVRELMEMEARAGLFGRDAYRALDGRLGRLRAGVAGALDGVRAAGGAVAAYGAAVGLTTLVYHLGLGPRLDFLVDDNPGKIGTFSPGLRIPVLAPAALLERRPAAVVLLAWRYQDAILARNRAYLDQGGRFLVPLPEVAWLG